MIRIACCDDNALQRDIMQEVTEAYVSERRLDACVDMYRAGRELLDAEEKAGFHDIYILELLMPFMNGMELAHKLRDMGSDGYIIFLSFSSDFVFESFDVKAFQYLLKPIDRKKFYETLDRALKELQMQDPAMFEIHARNGDLLVRMSEIVYAVRENRALHFHMTDGRVIDTKILRGSVQDAVKELLDDKRFVMGGASLVINLTQIEELDHAYILLKNGEEIFPPERSYSVIRNAWRT